MLCVYVTVRWIICGKQGARVDRTVAAPLTSRRAHLPPIDGVAMRELRTVYPGRVVTEIGAGESVLMPGGYSPKVGKRVLKGAWRGMPIFTLTLEERATCPVSCRHLRSCYGNHMSFAKRFAAGEAFEHKLVGEVLALGRRYPRGFVVRLHMLGDFYSVQYVKLWGLLLEMCDPLRVFGYTARWEDDIGRELRLMVRDRWARFAVRFSNAPCDGIPATISLELPVQCPVDTFLCPEQTGRTESCGTCAACWSTRKRVAFLQH